MKPLVATLLLGSVSLSSLAFAAAPTGTRLEGDHVHATAPAGWKALPDAALAVKNGLLGETTELTGDALAYGDARVGVFGVLSWIATKQPVTRVRAEIEGFLGGLHESLSGEGQKLTRWELSETTTRQTVRLAVSTGDTELVGVAVAVVDRQGRLHGAVLTCTRTGDAKARDAKASAARCEALVASFELSYTDAELKKLEKK